MDKTNTFIMPIIRPDYLGRCLETLFEYTEPNFYLFVIDQTQTTEAMEKYEKYAHLWIRPYRNLGFAKAINTGILLSTTPYVTALNDDVEFLNKDWWQGILDTFALDEKITVVNPNSPKEGAWGYGLTTENQDTWAPNQKGFLYDGKGGVIPVIDGETIDTPEKARTHYDGLLNRHPVWQKDTLCDALACWCTVFKREGLRETGLFDERFFPGGGEDYDMMARVYSCAWPEERDECNPDFHRRAVGTTKSWVWHHWGKSKDDIMAKAPDSEYLSSRPRWNANEQLWPEGFDVWGHGTKPDGTRYPYKRDPKVATDPL